MAKEINDMVNKLYAMSHTNECTTEYIGDGLDCICGLNRAIHSLEIYERMVNKEENAKSI